MSLVLEPGRCLTKGKNMNYTFLFKEPGDDDYIEYTSGTLSKLTSALAAVDGTVDFKVKVSDVPEGRQLRNVKVFLTTSADLGVYAFNPLRPLTSYQNQIQEMVDSTGLFLNKDVNNEDWVQFDSTTGSRHGNGFLIAVDLLNNGTAGFQLKFVPSNAQPSERLFIGLDVEGTLINSEEQ